MPIPSLIVPQILKEQAEIPILFFGAVRSCHQSVYIIYFDPCVILCFFDKIPEQTTLKMRKWPFFTPDHC